MRRNRFALRAQRLLAKMYRLKLNQPVAPVFWSGLSDWLAGMAKMRPYLVFIATFFVAKMRPNLVSIGTFWLVSFAHAGPTSCVVSFQAFTCLHLHLNYSLVVLSQVLHLVHSYILFI
jgi:hypothetical protein